MTINTKYASGYTEREALSVTRVGYCMFLLRFATERREEVEWRSFSVHSSHSTKSHWSVWGFVEEKKKKGQ